MLDRASLSLRAASALVVLAGYIALISVRDYSPLLLFIPIIAIALTTRCEAWHARYQLFQTISRGITITYFCFIPVTVILLKAVPALVALIIFIQCHLLLHRKNERNYYYLYLMSFFLVLAACVQAPEAGIAPALGLFLISGAWALSALRLEADPLAVRAHAEAEVTSLRRAARATDGPYSGRLPIGATVAVSTLAIFLLTSLLFVATPRVEAGFLGRDNNIIRVTGFAQTVNLQGGGYVREDPTPVMQVELPGASNSDLTGGQMYWRVATLSNYANNSWKRKGLDNHYYPGIEPLFAESMAEFRHASENPHEAERNPSPGNPRVIEQRIFADKLPDEGIPCLDLPLKMQVEGRAGDKQIGWDGRQDMSIRLLRGANNQLDYTVWSEIITPNIDALRATPLAYPSLSDADLELLTEHDLLPETVQLAEDLTENADNPYDKVMAIQTFLTGPDFLYSLNLPPLPAQNAIDTFILRARRGHCEFFASAMTLMLRSIGMPARVVSGYRGGEWSDGSQAFIVRQSMAHLWLEVYFEGAGWVRFDPAPAAVDAPVGGIAGMLRALNDFQLRARLFWYREVISFDRGVQLQRLRALPEGIFRSLGLMRNPDQNITGSATQSSPLYLFVFSVAFGVLGALALRAYLRRRREAFPLSREQRQVVALYNELRTRLSHHGLAVQGLSAEEIEEEVSKRGWVEFGDIQAMLRLYNEVRFGTRPLERSSLDALLKRLRNLHPKHASGA